MQGVFHWEQNKVLAQGVSFFFVLSGFILTHVYGKDFDIKQFYLNRFARLWPVHFVCFLLVVAFFMRPSSLLLISPEQTKALANILMIHAWLPFIGFPFSFNGPSWSISTEFAFYLFFPFLIRSRHFNLIYAATAILVVSLLVIVENITVPVLSKNSLYQFAPYHLILQHPLIRVMEFATGVAFARKFATINRPQINGTTLELIALAVLLVYWLTIDQIESLLFKDLPLIAVWYSQCGGILFFALAISIFAWGSGAISYVLSNRVLVRLGEISFSTYMLHYIVLRFYIMHNPNLNWYWTAVVIVLVTYLGSYLLWQFVEVPARRAILSLPGHRIKLFATK
jgi:peptidoglycan/LPS O-acetylase OafA/YrhL